VSSILSSLQSLKQVLSSLQGADMVKVAVTRLDKCLDKLESQQEGKVMDVAFQYRNDAFEEAVEVACNKDVEEVA